MPSIPSVRVGANVVKQLREGINMDAVKVAASELKGAISRARARKAVPPAGWLNGRPPAQGLFDPEREHDACGVGIIADM